MLVINLTKSLLNNLHAYKRSGLTFVTIGHGKIMKMGKNNQEKTMD